MVIDGRLIRTASPGDHVGGLAACDWGGGCGYTMLARVMWAEPGRLLWRSSEDSRWLIDTEPTVHAGLARVLAGRLRER